MTMMVRRLRRVTAAIFGAWAFDPALEKVADRILRHVRQFHLASVTVAVVVLAGGLATTIPLLSAANTAGRLALLAGRQPALALRLAQLDLRTRDSGDGGAFDATLGQLASDQADFARALDEQDGEPEASALRQLYGAGYGLRARMDDLFELARRARLVADDGERASLLEALSREVVGQVSNRLLLAADLQATIAGRRMDGLRLVAMRFAAAVMAIGVVWALLAWLMERKLHLTAARLERLAAQDGLTGALTHDAFMARLHHWLHRPSGPLQVGLVVVDLDDFNVLNTAFGDAAADAALKAVARRLRDVAGRHALVARLGADAFAVAQPGLEDGYDGLARYAAVLLNALRPPVMFSGQTLHVRATAGTALAPEDSTERTELLRMARIGLREAKGALKGSVHGFHATRPDLQKRRDVVLKALIEGDLRDATCWLQPMVDATSGVPVRFEVLGRWTLPGLGMVLPAEFIPIAEGVGRWPALSAHIRNQAFTALVALHEKLRGSLLAWPAEARFPGIAINLAASELALPNLLPALEQAVDAAGMRLGWLTIEVKEDLVVEGVDPTVYDGLLDMRRRGARIALDDFGSGMANLGHLRRFEVDEIKIARAVVKEIGTDRRADAIVRGVVGFGNGMGIATSAHGVETHHQLEFLREAGCEVVQGLLFAPAMPIADIEPWIAGLQLQPRIVSQAR